MRKVKWKDKEDVIKFAKEMNEIARKGFSLLVFQYKGTTNYHICHVERRDIYERSDISIIWRP